LAEVVPHLIQHVESVPFGYGIHGGIAVRHPPGGVDILVGWANLYAAGVGGDVQPAEAAGGLAGADVLPVVEETVGGESPAGALHPVEDDDFGMDDGFEALALELDADLVVEVGHVLEMGGLFLACGPLGGS